MSILNQKTIKTPIHVNGVGLHTGKKVDVKILPSEPNSGILFKRVDVNHKNLIIPNYMNVCDTNLCTTIQNENGIKVSTIEHLMGAFYGLGIDNVTVEINEQEVPILDGSAKEWVSLILNSGLKNSDCPIKLIKIDKKIEIVEDQKFIQINKSKVSSDIEFEIKYPNCIIENQKNKVNILNDDLFEIYNSRTFCKFEDIDKLKSLGLAKGGSLDNAIVVDGNKVLNKKGLRFKNEFVNHKILDCMGDLYLSGYRIIGSLKCSQGGHSLTNKLLRKVFENKSNFSFIELKGKNLPHTFLNKQQLKSIA